MNPTNFYKDNVKTVLNLINICKKYKIIKKKYCDLDITDINNIKEKLYENYNVGVEHLNAIINKKTNKYSKEITLNILKKLNFEWNNIDTSYLKNIVDIAFKIQEKKKK